MSSAAAARQKKLPRIITVSPLTRPRAPRTGLQKRRFPHYLSAGLPPWRPYPLQARIVTDIPSRKLGVFFEDAQATDSNLALFAANPLPEFWRAPISI